VRQTVPRLAESFCTGRPPDPEYRSEVAAEHRGGDSRHVSVTPSPLLVEVVLDGHVFFQSAALFQFTLKHVKVVGASHKDFAKTACLMHPNSNLEMLMARYQDGDFAAATALIDCMSPQLHRFFVVQSASRADADDLLQDTWLRIHKVRHTYRPGEPVLPWFYGIARHVRVDHYRKAIRTTARERGLEEMSKAAATVPRERGQADDLESLLAPLSESQREVIEMLKVAGMSLEEVARATSSTVGSVKQKAHRAYKKLREGMSGMGLRQGRSGGLS
jgi:RNA polymerase sigma-70 factor, ECF subfamily